MEPGLDPDVRMAHYLCMNRKDEKQMEVAHVLRLLVDEEAISHEQLQLVLTYIREVNKKYGMYDSMVSESLKMH